MTQRDVSQHTSQSYAEKRKCPPQASSPQASPPASPQLTVQWSSSKVELGGSQLGGSPDVMGWVSAKAKSPARVSRAAPASCR